MELKYTHDALKFLSKLDQKSVNRIRAAIHGLTQSPPAGDIKALQGYSDGRKRLRVNGWRIIYRYSSGVEIIYIIEIGNRGDIYK